MRPTQRFEDALIARQIAHIADRAPADAGRRQAERAALGGERLEGHIGGDVRGLAGIAEQRRRRGIQDEKIQRT